MHVVQKIFTFDTNQLRGRGFFPGGNSSSLVALAPLSTRTRCTRDTIRTSPEPEPVFRRRWPRPMEPFPNRNRNRKANGESLFWPPPGGGSAPMQYPSHQYTLTWRCWLPGWMRFGYWTTRMNLPSFLSARHGPIHVSLARRTGLNWASSPLEPNTVGHQKNALGEYPRARRGRKSPEKFEMGVSDFSDHWIGVGWTLWAQ